MRSETAHKSHPITRRDRIIAKGSKKADTRSALLILVEMMGFEPTAPTLRT